MQERVSLDEAQAIIATQLSGLHLSVEQVDLADAFGRVLAEPFRAPFALPRFDNSMVDGFAVRSADLLSASEQTPVTFRIIGQQRAGQVLVNHQAPLATEFCVSISTGATIPTCFDAVVMQEQVQISDSHVICTEPVNEHACIRRAGEEFGLCKRVIPAGQRLDAAAIALLASFGVSSLRCYAKPRVVVLASGDELVPHDAGVALQGGQIYDANRALLQVLLQAEGARAYLHPLLPDRVDALESALLQASSSADLIITTGGASAGVADFMPGLVRQLGCCFFWRVRLKPGMPALFGRIGKTPILVLPGNPVSVLSTYLMLARPALQRLSGMEPKAPLAFDVPLAAAIKKTHARRDLMRAAVMPVDGELRAFALHAQGSHRLSSLLGGEFAEQHSAHFGLLDLPEGEYELPQGARVRFMPFSGLMS